MLQPNKPRILRFNGAWFQEFLLDDDLPLESSGYPMRVIERPFPTSGPVYLMNEGRDMPGPIYNYLNDRVYLYGTKDGVPVIVKFNPRTLLSEGEIVFTATTGPFDGFWFWDVIGDTLVGYDNTVEPNLVTVYDANTFELVCKVENIMGGNGIQAAPGYRFTSQNITGEEGDQGMHIFTVTGPTSVSDSGLILFPDPESFTHGWSNDGGYQRAYMVVGDRIWVLKGEDTPHLYCGYMLNLQFATITPVLSSEWSGGMSFYDPWHDIMTINNVDSEPVSAGIFAVDPATVSVIGGIGDMNVYFTYFQGMCLGDGTVLMEGGHDIVNAYYRFDLRDPMGPPLAVYDSDSFVTANAGDFASGNYITSSAMAIPAPEVPRVIITTTTETIGGKAGAATPQKQLRVGIDVQPNVMRTP